MNCSRGPVVDETALVEHLKQNPMFRVGLDVFEVYRDIIIFSQFFSSHSFCKLFVIYCTNHL